MDSGLVSFGENYMALPVSAVWRMMTEMDIPKPEHMDITLPSNLRCGLQT